MNFFIFIYWNAKTQKTPYFMKFLMECFFNLLKKRRLYRRARECEHGYNRFEACSRWNEQRAKWCARCAKPCEQRSHREEACSRSCEQCSQRCEHGYNTNERCTKPCVCRKRSAFPLTNKRKAKGQLKGFLAWVHFIHFSLAKRLAKL